jgi:hypothetical protein
LNITDFCVIRTCSLVDWYLPPKQNEVTFPEDHNPNLHKFCNIRETFAVKNGEDFKVATAN